MEVGYQANGGVPDFPRREGRQHVLRKTYDSNWDALSASSNHCTPPHHRRTKAIQRLSRAPRGAPRGARSASDAFDFLLDT